ncbi:Uma2 family endonuclease [Brevundimonas sp.]|uniref:Uma2 family endonuclease n=1 Tax=Brevundimonas sp. TaxID=1871086 RepID=UPI002ABA4A27|nr:Uma2 family endonuclease [Brevundimonas sp.]MDZ4363358.1 Uma2 family endonuclease [Brevundimonas sp.]
MTAHAFFPRTGIARHRFTVDDVGRMVEAGVIEPDARLEIVDGDLIEMPSEGEIHLTFKARLIRAFNLALGQEWLVIPDGTLHLSAEDAPEPDAYILPASSILKPVDPASVVLVVEIADTSLAYDLGRKAGKYAQYGLAEYWVVDVNARRTHVLKQPGDGAYHDITGVGFDQVLVPDALRTLALRFDDLVPPDA